MIAEAAALASKGPQSAAEFFNMILGALVLLGLIFLMQRAVRGDKRDARSENDGTAGLLNYGTGSRPRALDPRSDAEKRLQEEALVGTLKHPDWEIERQIQSFLITAGITKSFYVGDPPRVELMGESEPGDFNKEGEHIRARDFGEWLYQRGGKDLMLHVYYRVLARVGYEKVRSLAIAWDKIGEWQA